MCGQRPRSTHLIQAALHVGEGGLQARGADGCQEVGLAPLPHSACQCGVPTQDVAGSTTGGAQRSLSATSPRGTAHLEAFGQARHQAQRRAQQQHGVDGGRDAAACRSTAGARTGTRHESNHVLLALRHIESEHDASARASRGACVRGARTWVAGLSRLAAARARARRRRRRRLARGRAAAAGGQRAQASAQLVQALGHGAQHLRHRRAHPDRAPEVG